MRAAGEGRLPSSGPPTYRSAPPSPPPAVHRVWGTVRASWTLGSRMHARPRCYDTQQGCTRAHIRAPCSGAARTHALHRIGSYCIAHAHVPGCPGTQRGCLYTRAHPGSLQWGCTHTRTHARIASHCIAHARMHAGPCCPDPLLVHVMMQRAFIHDVHKYNQYNQYNQY